MKTLTNKLVMSVLALVLTGVALSVGVFAWFTVNNTATVQSFNGSVQTGDGFYVSLDGSTWVSTILAEDIQAIIDGSSFTEFMDLTSPDGVELNTLAGSAPATGYIEFNLYFVGSNAFTEIELTDLIISSIGRTWIPGISVEGTRSEGAANDPITEYAANAARVSFENLFDSSVVVGEQAVGVNGNTLGFGAFATNEAVLFYNAIMETALTSGQFPAADLTTVQPGSLVDVSLGALVPHTTANPSGIAAITPTADILNTIADTSGDYKKGAITVRIWIEGWDEQALNAILTDVLTVGFTFTGLLTP